MQLFTARLARPLLSKPLSSAPRYGPQRPSSWCYRKHLNHPRRIAGTDQLPRTLTTLAPLRPALFPFRQRAGNSPFALANPGFAPAVAATVPSDLVPSAAVSSHPALCGLQLRFGPRNTMNGHTRLVQKRRHGFLHRKRSKTGRRILLRRRIKGRRQLAW